MTYGWGAEEESFGLGDDTYPPSPTAGPAGLREGGCTVSIETSQNLDKQKASGNDKAKIKRSGKNPASVKIQLWWTYRIHEQVVAMLEHWDPNGPSSGGPFRFVHPEARIRRVGDVIVEKMSATEKVSGGVIRRITLDCVEWIEPKKVAPAGGGAGGGKAAAERVRQAEERLVILLQEAASIPIRVLSGELSGAEAQALQAQLEPQIQQAQRDLAAAQAEAARGTSTPQSSEEWTGGSSQGSQGNRAAGRVNDGLSGDNGPDAEP